MSWAAVAAAGVGVVGGALLSDGSRQAGTTTVNQDPWSGQQPYLRDLFSQAQSQQRSGLLAPANPYTAQAAIQTANLANDPNGLIANAQRQLGQTLGGSYLSPTSNPYLQGYVQQALDQVKQNVNSQFRGDNFGSSANQEFLAKTLANTALPIYAQNYANERQNQLNAATAAPGLQGANAAQLAGAGQLLQTQLDLPYTGLTRYQGLIGGQQYGSTTSAPYYRNPLAEAAGGALTGLQLYNAFSGPKQGGGYFGGAPNFALQNSTNGFGTGQADYSAGYY